MNFLKKHICHSFLFLILPLSIFLTFNKHSRSKPDSYKSVIWADAAGYYVYLPLWFIYGNNGSEFPENMASRTGDGFLINKEINKVSTKYTCGVALLQFPFFIASHAAAKLFNKNAHGFSLIYQRGIMIAAVFYACFGLWFLCLFLNNSFNEWISFLTPLMLYTSTNLYYYSIDASGMSHVYSFFLCSLVLWSTNHYLKNNSGVFMLMVVGALSLAVLIRPTNILFTLIPAFYNIGNRNEIGGRVKMFLNSKLILIASALIVLLVFTPQLLYWYSIKGKIFFYSYGNESFNNWNKPQLLKLWFSTNNGLFPYSPLILAAVAGILFMVRKKINNGILIGAVFIIASYLFASWHDWKFGCSFGSRPFVEFYPLLAIPLANILIALKTNYQKILALSVGVIFCCLNFDLIYYYDGCFYGGDWDLTAYLKLYD